MAERLIYNHADVIKLIRQDAEQRGIKVSHVRWYYNMDDELKYEVIRG